MSGQRETEVQVVIPITSRGAFVLSTSVSSDWSQTAGLCQR